LAKIGRLSSNFEIALRESSSAISQDSRVPVLALDTIEIHSRATQTRFQNLDCHKLGSNAMSNKKTRKSSKCTRSVPKAQRQYRYRRFEVGIRHKPGRPTSFERGPIWKCPKFELRAGCESMHSSSKVCLCAVLFKHFLWVLLCWKPSDGRSCCLFLGCKYSRNSVLKATIIGHFTVSNPCRNLDFVTKLLRPRNFLVNATRSLIKYMLTEQLKRSPLTFETVNAVHSQLTTVKKAMS